jgi:Glycosyltransferase (GlcNAc)
LRFFTHGYDVYTPDHVLVTHDYHGHQSNPHVHTWHRHDRSNEEVPSWPWLQAIENAQSKVRTKGTKRVNMLLGIGKEEYSEEDLKEIEQIRASRFGLGTKRSLEQAGEFSGINLRERKMVKNKCGNLIWVPFDPHPVSDAYGIQQTLKRGLLGAQNSNSAGEAAASAAANAMLLPISPENVLNNMVQRRDTTLLRGNSTDGAHFDFHGAAKVAGIIVLVFVGLERIFFRLRRKKGDRYEN